MALPLVELVLYILIPWDIKGVDLADSRISHPERHDVVEVAFHRRDEPVVLSILRHRSQKSIGKSFLINFVVNDIARIQSSNLSHDLPGSPVDHPRRSGIVAHCLQINIPD